MIDFSFPRSCSRLFSGGIVICLLAVSSLITAGCSESSGENVIPDFIKTVNENTSSGVYASVLQDSTLLLSMKLDATPVNMARIKALSADQDAKRVFEETITKSMTEGDVLARLVKEKRSLAFQVEVGEEGYHVIFTPKQIRDIAFKDN